jgi:hypothetical protein
MFLNQTRTAGDGEDSGKAAGGPPLKLFAAMRIAIHGNPERSRSVVLRVMKNKAAGAPSECGLAWRNDAGLAEAP